MREGRSSQSVTLRVPAELDYRELVTRAVGLVCKVATSDEHREDREHRDDVANELVSAVGEAFNNIVLHGYVGRERGDVRIVATFEADKVEVEIRDQGASFDPSTIAIPDFTSLPESGMGLYIIRSFVDRFEYFPGSPNLTRLIKYTTKG